MAAVSVPNGKGAARRWEFVADTEGTLGPGSNPGSATK